MSRKQPDRLAAPAEILLAEQDLHLAFAQQVERRADGVERNHLGLRRIDARERVPREHRPAADGDPGREVGIAARSGGDDLRAANHVFLDVVDLDDLDAWRLRQRFLHAVQAILQVGGAEAGDERDLALAVQHLDRLLAEDAAGGEIVDAVERDALRRRRIGIPGGDGNAGIDRAIDRVLQEFAVERRDGDAVDALRDVRLEDFLLLQLIRRRRRVPQDLDVAEFRRRSLGADLRVVEDGDVERLRNDREAQSCAASWRRS